MKKGCCDFSFKETEKGFTFEFTGAEIKEKCKSWLQACCKSTTEKDDQKKNSCCEETQEKK
ncbi:MAG: hypothetical protein ACE5FU_11910 [Nitrospinota bacterium]